MSTTGSAVGQVKELKMMNVDEDAVKAHIDKIVRVTVEETLNRLLDEEADQIDTSTVIAGKTRGG